MENKTVQLLVTCLIDYFRPEIGLAVTEILESLNLKVEFPLQQTCCGQPAFNAGFWEDARAMARHTIDLLSENDAPVIVPSGSCASMMIHHYPQLLAQDITYAPKARELAARTYEFSQFLVNVLGITDLNIHAGGCLTYHASCHGLRGLGLKTQPRQLLDNIQGVEIRELPEAETCCGFGGLFALKMGKISETILQDKLDRIESTGANTVVGIDLSCLIHIGGGLHRRGSPVQVKHLAEMLRPDKGIQTHARFQDNL